MNKPTKNLKDMTLKELTQHVATLEGTLEKATYAIFNEKMKYLCKNLPDKSYRQFVTQYMNITDPNQRMSFLDNTFYNIQESQKNPYTNEDKELGILIQESQKNPYTNEDKELQTLGTKIFKSGDPENYHLREYFQNSYEQNSIKLLYTFHEETQNLSANEIKQIFFSTAGTKPEDTQQKTRY